MLAAGSIADGKEMQRFLVAFVSREGLTERIAHHVARFIEDRGMLVRLIDVAARETEAGADDCDALIVGGYVQRGRFDPELLGFIMRHGPALRNLPSAFLPVGVSSSPLDEDECRAVDEATRSFLAEAGWAPDDICLLTGIVAKPQGGVFDRQGLFAILEGTEAESRRTPEIELTDWSALDEFVRTFLAKLKAPKAAAPQAPLQ